MKPSLVLKMGQQLSMTPQLQQAIKLLQLSSIDLQQEIQEILESNSMLERQDSNEDSSDIDILAEGDVLTIPSSQEITFDESSEIDNSFDYEASPSEIIPTELAVDADWEDIYQSSASNLPASDDDWDFATHATEGETLQSHLLWQINLTVWTDKDKLIAINIVDSLNDDGYLQVSLDDILEGLDEDLDADYDEVEMVLHCVQQLDPIGVAARDLKESLLLQLDALFKDHPLYLVSKNLVKDHLDSLGQRDYNQLMRQLKLKEDQLKQVIGLIQQLNPRPGGHIASKELEYVVPDIVVRKDNNRWLVELNQESIPKLRVNSQYSNYIKRADNGNDNMFMKNQLQEARWFIKSLQSRNETLMKVATQIVEHQRGFLEYGEEAMKPLILSEIAEAIGMHESTVSRVTTQKYMHTPRGIYELKYFFSSHVNTLEGGEYSSTAIRAMIKKIVAAEDLNKPLSDSKLTSLLEEQGVHVARRTVAKYRESLGIASSSERKRLV